jgi:alcohol dehydrogenase, propanol-preferring
MRALRLLDWKSEPVLQEVDQPEPGPGQVVIAVGGAGACHSDLHLMEDFEPGALPWNPPFTLGHENAGWVHSLGEGVDNLEVGQPVAVYGPWGCGRCVRCLAGFETYCEDLASAPVPGGGGGLGLDGGMADYMLIPHARFLVPLPDGLEPAAAAPLTDAALTPYHAIKRSLPKLAADSYAVVIGVGGLGQMGVQILRAMSGATVIAVDTRPEALEAAEADGADYTFLSEDTTAEQIREVTGGRGADVIIDCVGVDATLAMGAAAARQMGDLTIVGIGGGTLPVSFFSIPYEVSVQTTYWGSRQDLVEVLNLGGRGMIGSRVTTYSLDDAVSAYEALKSGDIEGRAVVVPNEKMP